ncbi:MAG: ZIP family metal transporter [Patescibacteria group bacterium]|jgi:zinc and cadmium transporter
MPQIWLYSLTSVLLVSLVSLAGIITLSLSLDRLKKVLIFLVSFSAGAMLGDLFFHLLPEIAETQGFGGLTPVLFIGGMLLFFILEKYIHWTHCHEPLSDQHPHHLATMNLFGDGLHNFIDGLMIAASYIISLPLGIATTLAIVFHEIPQEIGEFGVLLHAGFSKGKAIFYNLISAGMAIIGTLIGLMLAEKSDAFAAAILPITAASFIYIATADLIPELHKETKMTRSFIQLISLILGAVAMYLLTFME